MKPRSMLAQCTVADLRKAQAWYEQLLERGPDLRPMDGLIEWHFGRNAGLQVWHEPDRAGKSTVVLDIPSFSDELRRLDHLGIVHDDPVHTPQFKVVTLYDPDGNRVVLTGD
jgi:hypothetical protein